MYIIMNRSIFLFLGLALACTPVKEPAEWVDPFIGTGGIAHCFPGATTPFGMVQLSPDTKNTGWDGCSGYRDCDSTLLGFSHTHLSGTGQTDFGDFLITPATGKIPFAKENETASPGYYSVKTKDYLIELTALPRTGCHRYTFFGDVERQLIIDLRYNIGETRPSQFSFETVSDQVIEGGRHVCGWAQDRWVFFSAGFSIPFTECKALGEDRYLLTFPSDTEEITVCVGISPTDAANARNNRLEEAPTCDFDAIYAKSKALWDEQLGKIIIEGGSSDQRTIFYTSLYHTLIAPNLFSDVNERPFYSTLSLWDTYRTWNPLQTLLNPQLASDMAHSLVSMYERFGRMPIWALGGQDVNCMIGYHSVSVIADAWLRGIRGFDGEKALEAMVGSSNLDPASEWYNKYGYIPSDFTPESVSRTLEFCYDDWCIYRMAESLGNKEVADEYYKRALRYRNLLDPSTGFFRGRDSQGNWRTPFNPNRSSRDYTEATAWQYRHYVPHDIEGYTGLMGGKDAVLSTLDSLFNFVYVHPDMEGDGNVTGLMGQYAHGNEPSHGSAWLFAAMGEPSITQYWVRRILNEQYYNNPEGMSGNEDCGQMSAWYVMASLGLYPLCPGTGEFIFAAPLFKKATVTLGNGAKLVITADHPEHAYVKDVHWNGESIDAQFITYEQLMQGGELSFSLCKKPYHGRDDLKKPYSLCGSDIVSMPYLKGNPSFFDTSFTAELACHTPDVVIRYTLDGSEPDENSTLYEDPFTITEACTLCVRAFKKGCQPSPVFKCRAFPVEYLPAGTAGTVKPGCRYTYHKGTFMNVAQVSASPIVSSGILPAPSIKGAPDADHFGFIFNGYIDVPEGGLWEFAVTSDDGAVLEIDGQLVVNGDGSHANFKATGHVGLRKGLHRFRLRYLEDYEGQNLEWAWKRPGAEEFEDIPESVIFY